MKGDLQQPIKTAPHEPGRKFTLPILAILLLACIFCAESKCAQSIAGQPVFQSYNNPQFIPEFSLQNLNGKIVNMENYHGKVFLLSFRATWNQTVGRRICFLLRPTLV